MALTSDISAVDWWSEKIEAGIELAAPYISALSTLELDLGSEMVSFSGTSISGEGDLSKLGILVPRTSSGSLPSNLVKARLLFDDFQRLAMGAASESDYEKARLFGAESWRQQFANAISSNQVFDSEWLSKGDQVTIFASDHLGALALSEKHAVDAFKLPGHDELRLEMGFGHFNFFGKLETPSQTELKAALQSESARREYTHNWLYENRSDALVVPWLPNRRVELVLVKNDSTVLEKLELRRIEKTLIEV